MVPSKAADGLLYHPRSSHRLQGHQKESHPERAEAGRREPVFYGPYTPNNLGGNKQLRQIWVKPQLFTTH